MICDSPRDSANIREWVERHPRISPYISVQRESERSPSSPEPFAKKRHRIHARIINDLTSFQGSIADYASELNANMEQLRQEFKDLIREPRMKSMNVRKFLFVKSQILDIKCDTITQQLEALERKKADVNSLLFLLMETALIPEDECFHLSPVFVTMRSITVDERSHEIERLEEKARSLIRGVSIAPQWKTDLRGFYTNVVGVYDPLIPHGGAFYAKPQAIEDELALCVDVMFPDMIKALSHASAAELPKAMLLVCKQIIPHGFFKDERHYSIAMMATFRVVYELAWAAGAKCEESTDPELIRKVLDLQIRPLREFQLPSLLIQDDIGDVSIHDYFWYDPMYREAAQAMTMARFASNPFDALHYMNSALELLEKKAVSLSNSGCKDAHGIGLDDMLCLFLGTFLASDMVDVFAISREMTRFRPTFPMSPPFEHTQATVEALALHLMNFVEK